MVRTPMIFGAAIVLAFALGACGPRADTDRNLDTLDNELVEAGSGNSRDPAMMAALQDQIMVDPRLAQQSNVDAVRPPTRPYSGAVPADNVAQPATGATAATSVVGKPAPPPAAGGCPKCDAAREALTLGALAARQGDTRTAGCANALKYSARWADRLPRDVPLYPGARVTEAAGADTPACRLRAVSFSTDAALQTVIDYYYARTTKAGYSAEHQADGGEHVLGGTRTRDGGAYALFFTARRDGGTDVDMVANNGS